MNAPRTHETTDGEIVAPCVCGEWHDLSFFLSRAAEGAAAPAYREALATAIELAKVAARNWHLVRYPDHPHDLADDCTEPVFVRLFSALDAAPAPPAVRDPLTALVADEHRRLWSGRDRELRDAMDGVREPVDPEPRAEPGTMSRRNDRPWLCPERERCEPLLNLRDGEYRDITVPEPGQSWSCWGRMAAPVTFVYDGVEHTNDLNACHYTPLKGVIRWQENEADWNVLASYYRMAGDLARASRLAADPEPTETGE